MQPGVTVVLATIWLAVYVNVVGTTSLYPSRFTLDQYTPLAPQQGQHGVYRRVEGQLDWKDQNPAENQPFDLSISPRRSISVSVTDGGSEERSYKSKYLEKEPMLRRSRNNADDNFSPLLEDKQFSNFVRQEGEESDVEGTKGQKSVSREPVPLYELENPPIANGTFEDQGPSSVEIYKLDQHQGMSPLSSTSITKIVSNEKSKTPKKTNHSNWKDKTTEYKASTSPKILRKQSNSSDDFSTEILSNHDPFSVGGVPELQVGCEGLEASDPNKEKRSIDYSQVKDKNSREAEPWVAVTPISLDQDYEISGEEGYEEMDELFKLKKLETATKPAKQNRGDMDPNLHSYFFDDKKHTDKLPVRGDLGKFNMNNQPTVQPVTFGHGNQQADERVTNNEALHPDKGKEELQRESRSSDGSATGTNQRRKILSYDDPVVAGQPVNEVRGKREIWGFRENEGVSSEIQTATERLRNKMRRREERNRQREKAKVLMKEVRRLMDEARKWKGTATLREQKAKNLKEEARQREEAARRLMDEARKEEEQARRLMEEARKWQVEARRLIDEARKLEDEARSLMEEAKKREEEARKLKEAVRKRGVLLRQRHKDENMEKEIELRNQRLNEEREKQKLEAYRRNHGLSPGIPMHEVKRRWEEEEEYKKNQYKEQQAFRKLERQDLNLRVHDAQQQFEFKQMQEAQKLWQQRKAQREKQLQEAERLRQKQEAERQQQEKERRRRQEAEERERKHQEFIRRNQPLRLKANQSTSPEDRRRLYEAGQYNRPSYPGTGNDRRNHGPWAPTNIEPRNYVEENRRREAARRLEEERIHEQQRLQQEKLHREILRREEEARKLQSRRYEEERKRLEAKRLEEERSRKELLEQLEHRRHDTSFIPRNLVLNESSRATELQKQRQEQERRRMNEIFRSGAMQEQWRRHEEARLNALPVSARIIVNPPAISTVPKVISRTNFDTDIGFLGVNPNGSGVVVSNFPAPPTPPTVRTPTKCTWAIVQCCVSNIHHRYRCFENLGCPGVNWDPNPCRISVTASANKILSDFYASN